MTLNTVIKRIQSVCEAHKQIRTFKKDVSVSNFLDDKTVNYVAALLSYNTANISTAGRTTTIPFSMLVVDLVNVSSDAKENEQDVLSDTLSICEDLIAQLANPQYQDWKINTDFPVEFFTDGDGDMYAGCKIDFSISFMYKSNRCVVPTTLQIDTDNNEDVKVYDTVYIADGAEGTSFTIKPTTASPDTTDITGKKILNVVREGVPIYPASNNPQFTWNNTHMGVSFAPVAGERFLILFRNY